MKSHCPSLIFIALLYVDRVFRVWKIRSLKFIMLLKILSFAMIVDLSFRSCVVQMMKQRHKVEREQNIGDEVGWSKNVEVAKVNPKLKAMNKKFGMIHGLSSLANIMAFGSLAMHSWYLAGKLDL